MVKLSATLFCAGCALAQSPAAPAAHTKDDNHILGIVPNYGTVNEPARHFQPISVKEKFKYSTQDSFDPFSWVIAGIYAGVAQWGNDFPGYGQGAQGYAKRYGAMFAD